MSKAKILFSKVWDHSTFIYNGRPMRKVSNAFSIDMLTGKDVILSLKDRVLPMEEQIINRNFHI